MNVNSTKLVMNDDVVYTVYEISEEAKNRPFMIGKYFDKATAKSIARAKNKRSPKFVWFL